MPENITSAFETFFANAWNDLLLLVVLWVFGRLVLNRIIARMVNLLDGHLEPSKKEKRAQTLRQVLTATGKTIIYALMFFIVLGMFGIDTTPFITGAGILGLAIGFGSQTLVKDFMSGLLVLYEGQYSVGDQVKIGAFEGTVKKITMRSTVLAGKDGEHIYIANGSISNVVNLSQPK